MARYEANVACFCKTCGTYQIVGKLNQVEPPAPPHPIPVFEHVIVDCVGLCPGLMAPDLKIKCCYETGKSWDEWVPFVLFAIGDAKQESLVFSPAELVFGSV